MKILGLTGDIACGKSTVARILAEGGAATLDSDLLVHDLYADFSFAGHVQELFDTDVRSGDGAIDRAKLGAVVFAKEEKLRLLESLVHPAVAALRWRKLRDLADSGCKAVVIEAVKLLESGQGSICDEIWCVVCSPEIQLGRLMQNRGLSKELARARLSSQPSREAKLHFAQSTPIIWIENNASLEQLAAQVARHWTRFLA